MTLTQAVLVILAPLIPIALPGIFFIRTHAWSNLLLSGSRIILWSMGVLTLSTTLGLYYGISVQTVALLLTVAGVVYALVNSERFLTRQSLWHVLAVAIPILIGVALFTIPFLRFHDGLPTGDVQKTILWAQESIRTNRLPDYGRSVALLNRDPVDFYTPGLHSVSALVMSLSPSPLTSMGIFSIVIAVCVAWIAASMTKEMFDSHPHVAPPLLAALFTLTQYRFLRYLREPGYHFQNVVGELFLFGMILLIIRFVRRREMQDAILFIICAVALLLSHQFSAFIAAFMIAAMALSSIVVFRNKIIHAIKEHRNLSGILVVLAVVATSLLFALGLGDKIPSIFTRTPHLTSLLPNLSDYPSTMGEFWFFAGLIGIVLMLIEARRKDVHHRQVILFVSATVALLLLSQGPALGIDIPPVRALFYIAVPLSIGAAYFFGKLFLVIRHTYHGMIKNIAQLSVLIAIFVAVSSSADKAFASLSHTLRTNSTLTGAQLHLIDQLKGETTGVLIDDYNRRSASWLVLSDAPMFTRIAADLERQMEESKQSKLRNELYLRQLAYEKIIELGSLPQIASLFAQQNIGYVTGIEGTSKAGFDHNPILEPVAVADDITLYKVLPSSTSCVSVECKFLLRSATLANDIGDGMDTFEHLEASVRTTRLSEPLLIGNTTYRTTTSPLIPLSFNVGDYVRVLWDPNTIGHPESKLTFMMWLTRPVQGLSLLTPSGEEVPLPYGEHVIVELPPHMIQINDKGFVSLTIVNSRNQEVPIDLISLGSSLVP